MVAQTRALEALTRLSQADPVVASAQLGPDVAPEAVAQALRHLRAALRQDPRPDVALELLRARIGWTMPRDDPDRRAALLTLMLARGAVRTHIALPFDAHAVAMAD